MRHLFVILAFVLMTSLAFVAAPSVAWADSNNQQQQNKGDKDNKTTQPGDGVQFFSAAQTKATDIFRRTKTIIYIVGAFGLMVLAVGAIFGKMAWKTLAYLALGLLLLVGAGGIITYLVGTGDFASSEQLNDTLMPN
ncbi:MAG: hypothetical protein ILP11_02010 [Alphaproteobacteria bacterium]|nr:hypothetical protein [Alphaproteobacteria bacterium]